MPEKPAQPRKKVPPWWTRKKIGSWKLNPKQIRLKLMKTPNREPIYLGGALKDK